jgi:acylphosphatase
VGYRDEVERMCRLNIDVKLYDVKIVAEEDEDKLTQFVENIKIQRYTVFVEQLDVSWLDATGESGYFEIKRGE